MNLLLIPGFMLDADLWTDLRPGLDALGTVIDADTTRDDSVAAMAERAAATLDGPTIVTGFSMGGYVAREVAYRAADKVAGLVLIATSSRGSAGVATPADAPPFRQLGRGVVARSLYPEHRSDAAIARIQAMSQRLSNDVFRRQTALARADDTARLGEITAPTLIVAAAQDQLRMIEESRALHDGIAGSGFETVDPSGHMIPIEQPERLLGLLQGFARGL